MKIKHTLTYSLTEEDINALVRAYAIIHELAELTNGEDICNTITGELMTLEDCEITLQSVLNSAHAPIEIVE